jgi:hypothetical protein
MMADASVSIKNYVDDVIRLSAKDIQQCATSREWFLKRIKNEIDAKKNSPILLAEEPFVNYGSYFKGTKVTDVDEYDILVVIDSCSGQYSQGEKVIGNGLGSASPNYKYQELLYKSNTNSVSSKKLVWWLQGIVQDVVDSFEGEEVKEDGVAVTAGIQSKGLKMDLVPCGVFESVTNKKKFYNIGDGNDSWTLTSPQDDIERIDDIGSNKEDFKNIVRICKRIRDQYGLNLKSFAIEIAVADFAEKITNQSWEQSNFAMRTFYCMGALAEAVESGQILDDWNKNLLDNSIDYRTEVAVYKKIAAMLNNRAMLMRYNSQSSLDNFIKLLFDNKS